MNERKNRTEIGNEEDKNIFYYTNDEKTCRKVHVHRQQHIKISEVCICTVSKHVISNKYADNFDMMSTKGHVPGN